MAKQLTGWLIEVALYKVVIDYTKLMPLEQAARLIRPPLPQDEDTLRTLILEFRRCYATERYGRTTADFETVKEKLLTNWQRKHCWSNETRNLFSSALSTYINFDRKSKPGVVAQTIAEVQLAKGLSQLFWEEEQKYYGG